MKFCTEMRMSAFTLYTTASPPPFTPILINYFHVHKEYVRQTAFPLVLKTLFQLLTWTICKEILITQSVPNKPTVWSSLPKRVSFPLKC